MIILFRTPDVGLSAKEAEEIFQQAGVIINHTYPEYIKGCNFASQVARMDGQRITKEDFPNPDFCFADGVSINVPVKLKDGIYYSISWVSLDDRYLKAHSVALALDVITAIRERIEGVAYKPWRDKLRESRN